MNTICTIIVLIALAILAMWLIKKLVETAWNLVVLYKASRDKNHPSRIPSSGVVLNTKTKKLEACGDKIILPF